MPLLRKTLTGCGLISAALILLTLLSLSRHDLRTLLTPMQTLETTAGEREYLVATRPAEVERILILLPGYKDHARQMAYYTGLHNTVRDSTLVVYAQATESNQYRRGWNASICCGNGFYNSVDDVAYLETLIETLRESNGDAETPVYLVGFSNGAMMAQDFAGQNPELVAGVVAHAGTLGADGRSITLSQPVPVLLMHGAKDTNVDFNGNFDDPGEDFDGWLSHAETLERWQTNNEDQAPVEARVYQSLAHEWPDWRILRLWHRRPAGSRQVVEFVDRIERETS